MQARPRKFIRLSYEILDGSRTGLHHVEIDEVKLKRASRPAEVYGEPELDVLRIDELISRLRQDLLARLK
jgi:hypothetical protein